MNDLIKKVIKGLECCTAELPLDNSVHKSDFCEKCPYGNHETLLCFGADLKRDALELLKSQQAEIERLKTQKQKWIQNIADQQLAVSPTGYETEEGLAKRTGEWNGLQMAWEILTEGR